MNFWRNRPPTPVVMAWMVAGAIALTVVVATCYGLFRFVAMLTS